VSWFSDVLDKLFGRTKEHTGLQRRQQKRPPAKKAGARTPVENKTAYPPDTLGYLLKNSPAAMPGVHAYDLQKPPPLAKGAREYLQARIYKIPPMPEIWHRVQEILQQDGASASDLGKCIAKDPVLTARILKVCNSSMYAGANSAEVSNIPLAIARIGLDEASSIIFRSLAPDLGGSEQSKLEIRHIWFHSQAIAMLSRVLTEASGQLSRHEATLIGMLHDIGKLVILHIATDQQLNQLKDHIDSGMLSLAAEQEVLGYTHIDAGMMLALHWKLPKQVQQSISFHHHPTAIKAASLPESLRYAMLTLHIAHLMLQYHVQPDGHKHEEYRQSVSIWQSHQRSSLHDTLRFAQQHMSITLDSESLYKDNMAEIERLKLSFPDLFGPEDEPPD